MTIQLKRFISLMAPAALLIFVLPLVRRPAAFGKSAPDMKMHTLEIKVTPMQKSCPRARTVSNVVRVVIPQPFDLTTAVPRNVRSHPSLATEAEEAMHDDGTWGANMDEKGLGPFDIDVFTFPKGATLTEVRVILLDQGNFTFDSKEVPGVAAGDLIRTTRKARNTFGLCGAKLHNPGDLGVATYTSQVAVFYVPMLHLPKNSPGHYNFVLIPRNNQSLSILVDPKVKNGG